MRYPFLSSRVLQQLLTECFMVVAILFSMSGFVGTILWGSYCMIDRAVTCNVDRVKPVYSHAVSYGSHLTQGATIDEGYFTNFNHKPYAAVIKEDYPYKGE